MPNDYFRFKEFTIHQDRTAMKVCTDACLFGAWVALQLEEGVQRVLDIGAGTGLLSLMIAQKSTATVDAVEIDEGAFSQAKENFNSSPWREKLRIYQVPIQQFKPTYSYDLIVCNPPFYKSSLKSPDLKRNIALHSEQLKLSELVESVKQLLKRDGLFAVLLPPERSVELAKLLADKDMKVVKKCSVKQSVNHPVFRHLYLSVNNKKAITENNMELVIKDNNHQYTNDFYELLKDYYLFEK